MGFDLSGMNPNMSRPEPHLPPFTERTDADWKTYHDWQDDNCGVYFRNNVWWWRPLWDYIQERLNWNADEGHYNDGFEVSEEIALKIAAIIKQDNDTGYLKTYEITHNRSQESKEFSYPFDSDNALEFASFCEQSGGFKIC